MPNRDAAAISAERKRKRLEAWRNRQAAAAAAKAKAKPKLSLKLKKVDNKNVLKLPSKVKNVFGNEDDDVDDEVKSNNTREQDKRKQNDNVVVPEAPAKKSRRRWDNTETSAIHTKEKPNLSHSALGEDALDVFMKQSDIVSAAAANQVTQKNNPLEVKEEGKNELSLEEEEAARRQFIEALRKTQVPTEDPSVDPKQENNNTNSYIALSEIKNAKLDRQKKIEQLQREVKELHAAQTKTRNVSSNSNNDVLLTSAEEGGVMEESERELNQLLNADNDALHALAELNKKKELRSVDHSSIDYLNVVKNLFVVPRALARLSHDEVLNMRGKMKIRVRGVGCPVPIQSFDQSGLSERVLCILKKQNIHTPYPIQAQCLPAIMAGRDVIGIAKTGSGKTLAYLLPMIRHILAQPDLEPYESGPIGLVLAPARELAVQIYSVAKHFSKNLNLKSTAIYGGAGVAEQIGDLKRGCHIVVATPGRMIDVLTMQSGKLLSLSRVSFVVMDEADRMFDMGFAPQITSIISAIRPDRQIVLFSATFPKTVEALARKSLSYPIEVLVGGRSVASDTITQYGECMEEGDKFLRLLQLLGEHIYDGEDDIENDASTSKKCIIFVDTQLRADALFEQLIRSGYLSCQSLHGGKEQEDRDNTISDFKRHSGPDLLVATSVAGRGLDVPSIVCVINYSAPSHLEDYVHRVGRTGRAGRKGVAYTFVNNGDESKFAPIVCRAMTEAGQAENISLELKELSDSFKEKVKKGEAKFAGSGFKGKGYSYDASELSDAQKLVKIGKRQALIEAGMLDEDDDQGNVDNLDKEKNDIEASSSTEIGKSSNSDTAMTAGMQDAIMRKLGLATAVDIHGTGSHFSENIDINDFPREARWKVTQKETISRMQDEYACAITLKGEYYGPGREPKEGEEKLHLHLQAQTNPNLLNCVHEIKRLLNEETLRVGSRNPGSSAGGRYNVMG